MSQAHQNKCLQYTWIEPYRFPFNSSSSSGSSSGSSSSSPTSNATSSTSAKADTTASSSVAVLTDPDLVDVSCPAIPELNPPTVTGILLRDASGIGRAPGNPSQRSTPTIFYEGGSEQTQGVPERGASHCMTVHSKYYRDSFWRQMEPYKLPSKRKK